MHRFLCSEVLTGWRLVLVSNLPLASVTPDRGGERQSRYAGHPESIYHPCQRVACL